MPNTSKNDKTRKGGSGKQQGGQGKGGQTSRENNVAKTAPSATATSVKAPWESAMLRHSPAA